MNKKLIETISLKGEVCPMTFVKTRLANLVLTKVIGQTSPLRLIVSINFLFIFFLI